MAMEGGDTLPLKYDGINKYIGVQSNADQGAYFAAPRKSKWIVVVSELNISNALKMSVSGAIVKLHIRFIFCLSASIQPKP